VISIQHAHLHEWDLDRAAIEADDMEATERSSHTGRGGSKGTMLGILGREADDPHQQPVGTEGLVSVGTKRPKDPNPASLGIEF
jgi:hypothetical protein